MKTINLPLMAVILSSTGCASDVPPVPNPSENSRPTTTSSADNIKPLIKTPTENRNLMYEIQVFKGESLEFKFEKEAYHFQRVRIWRFRKGNSETEWIGDNYLEEIVFGDSNPKGTTSGRIGDGDWFYYQWRTPRVELEVVKYLIEASYYDRLGKKDWILYDISPEKSAPAGSGREWTFEDTPNSNPNDLDLRVTIVKTN